MIKIAILLTLNKLHSDIVLLVITAVLLPQKASN